MSDWDLNQFEPGDEEPDRARGDEPRDDDSDPLLDACLEEVLGGQSPPDLHDRIMESLASGPSGGDVASVSPASSRTSSTPLDLGLELGADEPHRRGVWLLPLTLAASVALVLAGYWLARFTTPSHAPGNTTRGIAGEGGAHAKSGESPPVAKSAAAKTPDIKSPPRIIEPPKLARQPAKTKTVDNGAAQPKQPPPQAVAHVTSSDNDIIAAIDGMIRRGWTENRMRPAPPATDAEWCRRVFLDLIGRIPTLKESEQFLTDKAADKKQELVDRLLHSDDYVEELARNWTNVWANLLIGRDTQQDRGGLVHRVGFQQFLRLGFLRNKPFDEVAFELISATGSNRPGDEDYNPAVSFVMENLEGKAESATAKTARLFLGRNVQCTQCHNHPFNDWRQREFWELNSFFRQARAKKVRHDGMVHARLVNETFEGDFGDPDEAGIVYELRNGLMTAAFPVFLDGTKISPSGWIEDVDRRTELAKLVVKSELFPQAIVNRAWSHFMGFGFTRPVDDIGPHNRPSHPELLDRVAREFAGHGFDMRRLFRWVTLSEAYSLSSQVVNEEMDDPAAGDAPLFARFYLRQMRPEELYQSLLVAAHSDQAHAHQTPGHPQGEAVHQVAGFVAREKKKSQWLQQFTMAYGTDEKDEATTFNGTIPQTLMMFNGDLIETATSGRRGTFLHRLATSDAPVANKVNKLFTAALSRRASKKEIDMAHTLWKNRRGDTLAALQDVWWAVLNSGEFILNH